MDTTRQRKLDRQRTVSVVVPCFNEAAALPLLFERLRAAAERWPCRWEVVLVDDGSTDATWSTMLGLREKDPRWKLIRLARNFGHQAALWTGLKRATGDLVAVLDADLQDPPEVLPEFFRQWEDGHDVVYGIRTKRKEGRIKRAAYFCFYRLLAFLSEVPIPLDSGDFCVMDRRVVEEMVRTSEMEPFVRGIRAWVGFRQTGVHYERGARAAGRPRYSLQKLFGLAVNGIFSFSTRPLRIATWLGFGVSILSFLGGVFTFFQRLFPDFFDEKFGMRPVEGFATIVIAILFLGGVQLICLGILGEYVGRIYENVKGRPQSVIRETLGFRPGGQAEP